MSTNRHVMYHFIMHIPPASAGHLCVSATCGQDQHLRAHRLPANAEHSDLIGHGKKGIKGEREKGNSNIQFDISPKTKISMVAANQSYRYAFPHIFITKLFCTTVHHQNRCEVSASKYKWAQVSTRQHNAVQVSTSEHKSVQISTSQNKSGQVRTRGYNAIRVSTSQYKSAQITTREYNAVQVSEVRTSHHQSAHGNITQYKSTQVSTSEYKGKCGVSWQPYRPENIVAIQPFCDSGYSCTLGHALLCIVLCCVVVLPQFVQMCYNSPLKHAS